MSTSDHDNNLSNSLLLVVLGDFNCDISSKDISVLRDRFSCVVPSDEVTGVGIEESGKSYQCYDNIWLSHHVKKFHTSYWGVIRKGLWHLAIPKGWSWGGYVSSHCPVWAEFYVPSLSSLTALSDEVDLEVSSPVPNGGVDRLSAS